MNLLFALHAGSLFFGVNLHLHVVRALADSLGHWPLGRFFTQAGDALIMVELGSSVFETAVRLALPVIVVLLLVDLTLGLVNSTVHHQPHSFTPWRYESETMAAPGVIAKGRDQCGAVHSGRSRTSSDYDRHQPAAHAGAVSECRLRQRGPSQSLSGGG